MSYRAVAPARVIMRGGRPFFVNAIPNPTVEDVVITEARLFVAELDHPGTVPDDHKVSRTIRDFLVRLNVER